MTALQIRLLLDEKLCEYAEAELRYDAEIKKANPYSQEFRELTYKYNTAINKKFCIEELLDIIEGSEGEST